MGQLFWRALPITTLTVRQFAGGKAIRVVVALAMLPVLFGVIFLLGDPPFLADEFLRKQILEGVYFPTLLPIIVLILATGAIGNELEDRTLAYLFLKPVGRWRIVVEKWLGAVVVLVPALLLGLAVTGVVIFWDDPAGGWPVMRAALVATAVGALAYAAIFLWVSLLVSRALLVGMLYTFLWETTLGRFLPGLRVVSVRHFVTSVFDGLDGDPLWASSDSASLRGSIATLFAATVIALLLATRRMRRTSLE